MPKKTAVKKDQKKEPKAKGASSKASTNPSRSGKELFPEVNIGLIGHVDHGKTTLTEKLSGMWTDTHSEEIKRGITIRLGYADCTVKKCKTGFTNALMCDDGSKPAEVRKISLVDAPGHESLMATMLAGTTIIDGAILLVAANEECPQPQTKEHLMALEITGLKNLIIVQNKIDLVNEEGAIKNYEQIKKFLKGTSFENAPIIPISAQHNINIDLLLEAIEEYIPTPKRDENKSPLMFVARSFDINKPGSDATIMVGGILGGALIQGKLKPGEEIEIRPGRRIEKENKVHYESIFTKILSINSGKHQLAEATPGGTLGLMTNLDPSIVKSDSLVGSVVGHKGELPPVLHEIIIEPHLLERVVGSKEDLKVDPLRQKEMFMLNVNSAATVGIVTDLGKKEVKMTLKLPICAEKGDRITISRRIGNRFRLIGYGILK